MTIQEIRTFKDIQDAIMRRGKIQDTPEKRNDLKEKINTFYQNLAYKKAYRWSGETKQLKLRGRYTTGTIAITQGEDVITGTGTTWSENLHLYSKIKIGSDPVAYTIVRVASTTSITIDGPYLKDTLTAGSYEIFKDEYGLYPDLMNVRKLHVSGLEKHILPASPEEVDRIRYRYPFTVGTPKNYTIYGLTYYNERTWATFNMGTDYWEDEFTEKPRNKRLIVWPGNLISDTMAQIRYTKIVEPLGLDDDEPLVPYENRRVLVYGPLAEYFLQSSRDIQLKREWQKEHKAELKSMESDVETTDAELILTIDRKVNRRRLSAIYRDDDCNTDS